MSDELKISNPKAEADMQDPLPEMKFTFRRLTTWVAGIWILILLGLALRDLKHLNAPDGIVTVAVGLEVILGMILTYYLIAPSAQHIVDIFARVGAMKEGVIFKSSAAVHSAVASAKSDASAGKPQDNPAKDKMAWEQ